MFKVVIGLEKNVIYINKMKYSSPSLYFHFKEKNKDWDSPSNPPLCNQARDHNKNLEENQ